MSTLTWVGSAVSDGFAPTSWAPQAIPQPGDHLIIPNGFANIASGDPEPIDGESVKLGSTDFSKPATIDSINADFGPGFALFVGPESPYAALALQGTTTFDGTITANGGQLQVTAPALQGSGTTSIAGGGIVTFNNAVPASQTVRFLDDNGTLALGTDPASFAGLISDINPAIGSPSAPRP